MKRILESFYIISALDKHKTLKNKLLKEINKAECDSLDKNDSHYTDKINRLDWSQSKNFDRKWVKIIYPYLKKFFEKELNSAGYGGHVPVTEISDPYDPTKQLSLKVKEGDISLFPAYSIHRSPVNNSKKTKTIISFNIEICDPTKQILDIIEEHNKTEHSKDYLYSFVVSSIDNNELVDYSLKVESLLKRNLKRLDNTDWYGTFTTANHDKYNFLTFPNKQVSKLYREIYRNVSPLLEDKPYMIKCWLNVFRKGEKVDWHNHWPAHKKVWHGFYCVQVGDSFTEYRIPKVKDVVKVKSKEGLLVVGKSEDDQHRSSPWNEEQRPRITVAFDIVPIDSVDNELRVNHFIPFKI